MAQVTSVTYTAADLPPLHPTDRAAREAVAAPRYDLAQQVTALRVENRILRQQLHRQEDALARYRVLDQAADVLRQQHTCDEHAQCATCRTAYPCAVIRVLDPTWEES